jgi:hypothetical protein
LFQTKKKGENIVMSPDKITEIFYIADNYVKALEKNGFKKSVVGRKSTITTSEYLTLLIIKQESSIKTIKSLYEATTNYFRDMFPNVPSYQQFDEGINKTFPYLLVLTKIILEINKERPSNYSIADSAPLPICSNGHRYNLEIDLGLASSSKNLNGWYYGFKLHIIVNDRLEFVSLKITTASVKDYNALDEKMTRGITGWLIGDKGYICAKKAKELAKRGLFLLTRSKTSMKKRPATKLQNFLLSKRQPIEGVFSKLFFRYSAVTKSARSLTGFFVQVFSAILVYSLEAKNNPQKLLEYGYQIALLVEGSIS